jgi:hypothetical protein
MIKRWQLLTLLLLTSLLVNVAFFPAAHATTGPIIWSNETVLMLDPAYTWWDPDTNETYTEYLQYLDEFPSVSASVDNRIWVAWQREVPPTTMGKSEIFYKVYNGNWNNETQVTNSVTGDYTPAILATSDNKVWIFWMSEKTGNNEIFYKTSSNSGASWSAEVQVTSDPRRDSNPAVAQTSDGKIWLVWSRQVNQTSGVEHIFYKTFNGTEWSNETELTTGSNFDLLPSITQAKDGKVWIFWSRNNTSSYQILYKTYNGSAWSDQAPLPPTSDASYVNIHPDAFTEQDGTIGVFWQRRRTNSEYYDVYYTNSSDNGATWPVTYQFTNNQQYNNFEPAATQAPDKSLWVFWASTRDDPYENPNSDIYIKRSVLGDVGGPLGPGLRDGLIDTTDLNIISKALTTTPSSPHGTDWGQWNPDCDLNADNKINILDLAITAINYGLHA